MKQFGNRGRKIDYDAPGQIGRFSPKPEKLKRRPRFNEQLDGLVDFYDKRGEPARPLSVTLPQLMTILQVPDKERLKWKPKGGENYKGHPFLIVDDEP